MRAPIGVLVIGTGKMGSAIARLVYERPGLELVGVCTRRASSRSAALQRELGCRIGADPGALAQATHAEVAIQATRSRLADVADEIEALLVRGVHVISIAEEMAWPAASSPELADRLDRLARANGVGVLGTGVNPGFVLDLLVVALTGACARVDAIRAERVNDLSPYGPSVLRAQGVGLTPEAFEKGVAEGSVVGHHGFAESIGMIAQALGWQIERIEETREPIVSQTRREAEGVTVLPGCAAGCLHTAVAWSEERPVITLVHPQQIHPQREGVHTRDRIEIDGTPDIRLEGAPEIPGGVATTALAVNMIPRLLAAGPGLFAMTDLPVPAATMADVRGFIGRRDDDG